MRISDWSSDVCSSDLRPAEALLAGGDLAPRFRRRHYGGRIAAERGVLGIRLHDHLLARRKAAAVARPARCRQSYRVQQSLGRGLGAGPVAGGAAEIGRAWGRDRAWRYV